jgi:hypothetical protein
MKRTLVERNIVAVLFVLVLVTFSMAQRDSKKIERIYTVTELVRQKLVHMDQAFSSPSSFPR